MDWSLYSYLAGVAVAGVVLLVPLVRSIPTLMLPHEDRRRPVSEVALLSMAILLGCLAIYGPCLIGFRLFGYWDVGSDTLEQYVPFYENMVTSLRAGTYGPWNFQYGLGSSFMAYASWSHDPFNLLTIPLALLFGVGALGRILALVQIVKMLLSGLLFDHLLTFYCRAPLSRMVGGTLFAFGGWLVLWGQHYWIGAVYVMSCLIALTLELLMERWSAPRFLGVMAVTAASVLMSVYAGFMVMLFATAYALLRNARSSQCASSGQCLRSFGALALPVVCGLLCSCVLVVPYAILILGESSRVTSAGGMSLSQRFLDYLTGFVPPQWVPLILSRILGNGLVETGGIFSQETVPYADAQSYLMNSYEFLMVGAGGMSLVLATQATGYVLRHETRRNRVLVVVACTLTVLYCVNFFLPALSSAFDLKFRGSFAVVFPLLIAASLGWERIVTHREVLWPELALSLLVTLGTLVWSLVKTVDGRLACLWFLAAVIVGLLALVTCGRAKSARPFVAALACVAVVSMPIADGFFSTNERDMATRDTFPAATATDQDTQDALAYLRRRDSDFYRVVKSYGDWTRLNDSLVQGFCGVSSYNSTTDSDVVAFYRETWPETLSAGGSKQDVTADLDHRVLLDTLGVRYLLSKEPLSATWLRQEGRFGSVYVYRNSEATSIATFSPTAVTESQAEGGTPGDREAVLSQAVIVPDEEGGTGTLPPDTRASNVGNLSLSSGSWVTGSVEAPSDGFLCLAIPHTSGWQVFLDGQEVRTFRADYGFIGLNISRGSHELVAQYRPTGLGVGMALAACGLLLGVISCAAGSHREG